jgi:serine/threonine protein kinase
MEIGKPVYKADARRILHDIGQALYFMHSKGFIHRDVKPQNIVQVGKVYKLIDFGLTRKGTCNNALSGYMVSRWFRPPELLEAKEDLHYDGRVDMYSLALSAYFLHRQKPLFSGETPVLLKLYKRYTPHGLYKYLICDYKDRFTSEQFLKHCNVAPIDGSEDELPYRTGNVATFVDMLRGGASMLRGGIGYKGIYNEL